MPEPPKYHHIGYFLNPDKSTSYDKYHSNVLVQRFKKLIN